MRTQVTFDCADPQAQGAELIATHSDRGPTTYVMRDPEGNEFCLH
jgi:hypothetical protein